MSNDKVIITSKSAKQLRNVAKFAKSYVLKCQNDDCDEAKTQWYHDDKHDWLIHLKCTKCHGKWSICNKCVNFHIGLTTQRKINMHKNTYHNEKKINHNIINNNKRKNVVEKIDEYMLNINNKKKIKTITSIDNDNNSSKSSDSIASSANSYSNSHCNSNDIENYIQHDFCNDNYIQINDDNDINENGINGKKEFDFI